MLTSYVTLKSHPEFMRNQTGFGYMVYDIAKAVAKTENVDLLATDSRGGAFKSDSVLFLKRTWWLFVTHIFQCLPLSSVRNLLSAYSEMQRGTKLRVLYYWLMTGYVRSILVRRQYDIVHIHGCSFASELWMQVCKNCNQKYLVTLHGLNSFSNTVKLEPAGKRYERIFLKRVIDGELSITVISTGMKRLIEKTYGVKHCNEVVVVCNAFSFPETNGMIDVRQLYGLPSYSNIIVCVGNVCERKNQGQLIRAFDLLPEDIRQQTYILFLGKNVQMGYTIDQLSANSIWRSHFISCGIIPKDQVSCYYQQCDAVVLMSLSEGFGLSFIEGMHFGKPCLSFTDVDAYEDIYHPDAMIGVNEHSDEAVANGLVKLFLNKWNPVVICEYSRKFQSDSMAAKYISVYKRLLT